MTLDEYLTRNGIKNADWAARLRERGVKASESWVSQVRNGASCHRKFAVACEQESHGEVSAIKMLGLAPVPDEDGDPTDVAPAAEPAA